MSPLGSAWLSELHHYTFIYMNLYVRVILAGYTYTESKIWRSFGMLRHGNLQWSFLQGAYPLKTARKHKIACVITLKNPLIRT
jgi:hypothetical protein